MKVKENLNFHLTLTFVHHLIAIYNPITDFSSPPLNSEYLYCVPLNANSILKLHILSGFTDYYAKERA